VAEPLRFVLVEHLAVVGEQQHDRVLERARRRQRVEQPAHAVVEEGRAAVEVILDERRLLGREPQRRALGGVELVPALGRADLRVIGARRAEAARPLRPLAAIGAVRVVEVHPGEEGPALRVLRQEPGQRERADRVGAGEHGARAVGRRLLDRLHLGRLLKAAPQPELEQRGHRREGAGAVARGLEDLGRRGHRRERMVPPHHAVLGRIEAGHDRGVRGGREAAAREGVLEDDRLLREGVEARRDVARGLPVGGQPVGAQRVERDDEHVGPGLGGCIAPAPGQRGRGRQQRGERRGRPPHATGSSARRTKSRCSSASQRSRSTVT
jgi:hypothetical protein